LPKLHFNPDNFWGGGLVLFILAGFCLFRAGTTIAASIGQDQWQPTTAQVVEAHTRTTTNSGGRTNSSAHFRYVYEVEGREYSSERYSLKYASTESIGVDRFRVGDRIDIYYNPDDPTIAVGEKGQAGIFVYLFGALGLFFAGFGFQMTFSQSSTPFHQE
jgi:hypothetical protein